MRAVNNALITEIHHGLFVTRIAFLGAQFTLQAGHVSVMSPSCYRVDFGTPTVKTVP